MIYRDTEIVGVMLVNTGSPEEPTPRATKAFIKRFLSDPHVVSTNPVIWWFVLRLFILPKRSIASADRYREIWTQEGSPLIVAQEKIAQNLEQYYRQIGRSVLVRSAMSYSNPSIESVLDDLRTAGCTRLVVLPLYPQQSTTTTSSVRDAVKRHLKKSKWKPSYSFITTYHDNPTYLRAIAASIRHAGYDAKKGDRLLFSYHSLPLEVVNKGDKYANEVDATSVYLAQILGLDKSRWSVGYMSQMGDQRGWLSPFSRDILVRWALGGSGRVYVVCPNFAFDCLETLYDVDKEYRHVFESQREQVSERDASQSFVYVPCLHQSKAHIKVLSDVLQPYVEV